MTRKQSNLLFRSPIRWLATAGAAATLMVPLAANADHRNGDLVEIVASAAVAYVVVDAVGGFDNDKHRRHKRDRDDYRDQRGPDRHTDRHASRGHRNGYDHWGYSRAHRARVDHRREHAYRSHQRLHRHDHRRYDNQHRKHHRKQSKHHRAYH